MIMLWEQDGWKARFAYFPMWLNKDGKRRLIWLDWYWSRDCGDYTEITRTCPAPSKPVAP